MVKNVAGIYSITNEVNGHKYIGQSRNIYLRWKQHKLELKNNRHGNQYLQNAYNKYGKANFTYRIVERIKNANGYLLDEREQYWISKEDPAYNIVQFVADEIDGAVCMKAKFIKDANDVIIIKRWQKYKAPKWTAWVYGGEPKPRYRRGRANVSNRNGVQNSQE